MDSTGKTPKKTLANTPQVCEEYTLQRETYHLTVNYVDRLLSTVPNLKRTRLQLLGAAALLIAGKAEEYCQLSAAEVAKLTDYTFGQREIVATERSVLRLLDWQLLSPTPTAALRLELEELVHKRALQSHEVIEIFARAASLIDYATFEPAVCQHRPSMLARAALILVAPRCQDALEPLAGQEEALTACLAWLRLFVELPQKHLATGGDHTLQIYHEGAMERLKRRNGSPFSSAE